MASSLSRKLVARLLQNPTSIPAAASGQLHSHLGALGALAGGNGTPGLRSLSSSTIASSPPSSQLFFQALLVYGFLRGGSSVWAAPSPGPDHLLALRGQTLLVLSPHRGVSECWSAKSLSQSRRFSSGPDSSDPSKEAGKAAKDDELRHQVIRGPTVERDVSALANETRRVLERMRKSMYDLSETLALLGLAHVVLGVWITGAAQPREVWIQGIGAFAFPFSVAFLLRWTLKPLSFFHWMEEQGRLQILTLNLQEGFVATCGNGLATACVANLGAQVTSIICVEVEALGENYYGESKVVILSEQ